jgi:anaerobic selenocysteine-containing dehydrogenase
MTRTEHVERARQRHLGPVLEVHPSDAAPLGLADGAIAQVSSRRGSVRLPVRVSEAIRPGVVCLPTQWGAPQPKVAAVRLEAR